MCDRGRFLTALILMPAGLLAQRIGSPTDDLDKVSVDELFKVQVTSVGRKAQELSKAPAAVYVLTAEDIRRSGATSIPEALEWVPGLTVLRGDGRSWVVSARGGARQYADRMLVMVDGRSLYAPTFSGVIWDLITVPMQDIERIEVVRGPGAVMWGPNAVNGVINIITKSTARGTRGQISQSNGNQVANATELGWGARAGDHLAYRVWGSMVYNRPAFSSEGYTQLTDQVPYRLDRVADLDGGTGAAGFRLESTDVGTDHWMAQGTMYRLGSQDLTVYPVIIPFSVDVLHQHVNATGGSFQARWTRTTSEGNERSLQFSYSTDDPGYAFMDTQFHNLTLDYQQRQQTGERNEIYWGVGFQQYWDTTTSKRLIAFTPAAAVYRAGDVVVRDEYQLILGKLMASAGLRVDYNSFSRWENQPSVRLLYTPDAKQSVWIAASRAVRVPSRIDRNILYQPGITIRGGLPITIIANGSPSMLSESERSFETGYRLQSGQRWSVDVSTFLTYYGRLIGVSQPAMPTVSFQGTTPVIVMPSVYGNNGTGRSYGAEVWGAWQVSDGWRLVPGYSYLRETRWLPANGPRTYFYDTPLAQVPHQFSVRSQHDLSRWWQLDLMARARSRNDGMNLPGTVLFDARLAWRPSRSTEVSASVQNLTDRRILETYLENPMVAIPLRRTFLIKLVQRF